MSRFIHNLKNRFGETSTHLLKTFLVYGFMTLAILISKILIARFYGQENLGIFTYFFSLVSLVFLFTSFGLPEALTQTIVKEPSRLKSLLRYYFPLITLTTLFFTSVTILLTSYFRLNPDIAYFKIAIIIYLVIYTLFYTTYSILRGFKRFVSASLYSLIGRIFFIAFIITAFLLSFKIIHVLLSLALSFLIAALFSFPQLKKLVLKASSSINLKKYLYLAFALFLMQVGFYSLRFLSEILISYLVDFHSLGLYSAHSSITNTIRLIAYVFPVVVLPMAAVSRFKLRQSLTKIIKLLIPFSAIILLAAWIFVPLFYGPEYKNLPLPFFLILSSTLLVIYSYLNSVFVGENKFSRFYLKIISLDLVLSLAVNTLLNIYFILKLGLIGAPIATAVTIILKIALNYHALKKLRIKNGTNPQETPLSPN